MSNSPDPNIQSGVPAAETTRDDQEVAAADGRDGHYEDAPGQIVKVVHQVRPAGLPVQGPTDFEERGAVEDQGQADVRVTPENASVWEALPRETPADE